jgi:hypothetical protein
MNAVKLQKVFSLSTSCSDGRILGRTFGFISFSLRVDSPPSGSHVSGIIDGVSIEENPITVATVESVVVGGANRSDNGTVSGSTTSSSRLVTSGTTTTSSKIDSSSISSSELGDSHGWSRLGPFFNCDIDVRTLLEIATTSLDWTPQGTSATGITGVAWVASVTGITGVAWVASVARVVGVASNAH